MKRENAQSHSPVDMLDKSVRNMYLQEELGFSFSLETHHHRLPLVSVPELDAVFRLDRPKFELYRTRYCKVVTPTPQTVRQLLAGQIRHLI